MNIKELTYSAQQSLQSVTDKSFKRTHVYELLASSFGYRSYAALCSESVFTKLHQNSVQPLFDETFIQHRCNELGYSYKTDIISSMLTKFILEQGFAVLKLTDLISKLRIDSLQYMDWDYDDDNELEIEVSSLLVDCLESFTHSDNAKVHYALALIHKPEDFYPYDNYNQNTDGSSYWYSQAKKGKILTGMQKEFADEHAHYLSVLDKYTFHLNKAGSEGDEYALLDLAEYFEEPSFFEKVKELTFDEDPMRVADIADNLERHKDVKHWLTIAAESGDTDAMRRLIEEFDNNDLQRCWTWLYLAKMMGTDLTKSNYHAIHEDGSFYNDDVGGPMYADGVDGLNIPNLDDTHNNQAKKLAEDIFAQII
jgi:hypothetical protein